jgi:hypothetical protein
LTLWAFTFFSAVVQAQPEPTAPKKINVQILEKSSRVELISQTITLDPAGSKNNSALVFPLKAGKVLEGCKVSFFSRPISINSISGYLWFEISLIDRSGKTLAYSTLTTANGKFSLGSGFDDPSDSKHKLVFMIDTTSFVPVAGQN